MDTATVWVICIYAAYVRFAVRQLPSQIYFGRP